MSKRYMLLVYNKWEPAVLSDEEVEKIREDIRGKVTRLLLKLENERIIDAGAVDGIEDSEYYHEREVRLLMLNLNNLFERAERKDLTWEGTYNQIKKEVS